MPISNSKELFSLINSMDKSEKRAFRLYVNRLDSNKDVYFMRLFDVLDKMKQFDDRQLQKKFPDLQATKLANLKRHLYSQIMKSLRIVHANKDTEIQIRETLDFARILYGKGLYKQSIKLIDKITPIAKKAYKSLLYFEILEFSKLIESRHITRSRSVANKVESIISQTDRLKEIISSTSDFMNLSLRIQGLYIKLGFAKSERDLYVITEYLNSNLPRYDIRKLSFYEYVLLHQSLVWYHHMTLNFLYSYKHASQWIDHFDENPHMKLKDPSLYFRGLHYAMTNSFYLRDIKRFIKHYDAMKSYFEENESTFLDSTKILYHNYKANADLNRIYLDGNYSKGITKLDEIISPLLVHKEKLDPYRNAILNYKIGWLYFGAGQYEIAIDYLLEIINQTKNVLRQDVLAYTKLLHLMSHVALKHYEFAQNEIKNVKRYFSQVDEQSKTADIVFEVLRRIIKNRKIPEKEIIDKMILELQELRSNSLSSRPFLYFDFISWLLALQSKSCLEDIVQRSN